MIDLTRYAKFLAALAAFAGVLVAQGVLPPHIAPYVTGLVSAIGALGVYLTPNAAPGPLAVTVTPTPATGDPSEPVQTNPSDDPLDYVGDQADAPAAGDA